MADNQEQIQKLLAQVEKQQQKIIDAGFDPDFAEPRSNLVLDVLNTIDKPKQGILALVDGVFGRGDILDKGVWGTLERGFDENINTFDVLRREGVESPTLRMLLGFAGEVLLDPLTYVGGIASKSIMAGGKSLTNAGGKVFSELVQETEEQILKQSGKKSADLAKAEIDVALRQGDMYGLLKATSQPVRTEVDDAVAMIAANDVADNAFRAAGEITEIKKRLAAEVLKNPKGGRLLESAKNPTSVILAGDTSTIANRLLKEPETVEDATSLLVDILSNPEAVKSGTTKKVVKKLEKNTAERLLSGENAVEAILTPSTANAGIEQIARDLAHKRHIAEPVLNKAAQHGVVVDDMFQAPGVQFSASIPFMGHFTGKEKSIITEADNLLSKTFKRTGNVLGFDKVTFGKFDANDFEKVMGSVKKKLPKEVVEMLGKNKAIKELFIRTAQVADIQTVKGMEELEELNKSQKLAGIASEVAKVPYDLANGSRKVALEVFSKGDITRGQKDMLTDFTTAMGGTASVAERMTVERFPQLRKFAEANDVKGYEEFVKGASTEAFELIDRAVKSTVLGLDEAGRSKFVDSVNKAMQLKGGDRLEFRDLIDMEGTMKLVRQNIGNTMQKHQYAPEVKVLVNDFLDLMDELDAIEKAEGVKHGFIASYVPHVYKNYDEVASGGYRAQRKAGNINFKKGRKFDTAAQAFGDTGLIANKNLIELAHKRITDHLKVVEEKRLMNRMVHHYGMPLDDVKQLYMAADNGDEVATRIIYGQLKASHFLPTKINVAERQRVLDAGNKIAKQLDENEFGKAAKSLGEKEAKIVLNTLQGSKNATTTQVNLSAKSIDHMTNVTGRIARDIGESVNVNGVDYILPKPLATAIKETVVQKDIVKEAFKDSETASAFLKFYDAAIDFTKRSVTYPFPEYWSGNLIGDAAFRFADVGIAAFDGNHLVSTWNLMKNGGAMKTATGQTITSQAFKQILDRAGIRFAADDMIDVIDKAGDMNLDRMFSKLRQEKMGLAKTLKGVDGVGSALVEMRTAADRFTGALQDNFENLFRASHLAQHLKNGSSIQDAIRRTNDALIDYRSLSKWEKSFARRTFLFYSWMSRASAKAAIEMFRNPGYIQGSLKTARGISEAFSPADAPPTIDEFDRRILQSTTQLEQISFPIGRTKDGRPLTGRGFGLPIDAPLQSFVLNLPRDLSLNEISDWLGEMFGRNIGKLAAQTNPFIKTIAEQGAGKSLFYDVPLDAKFVRRLPDFADIGERIAPYAYNAIPTEALGKGLNAVARELLGAVPDGKGHLVADPFRYYLATQIFPGLSRLNSTFQDATDKDRSFWQKVAGSLTRLQIEEDNYESTLLYKKRNKLQDFINRNQVRERIAQDKEEQ